MLRRFLRDSAIYGTGSLLVRGVALLLVPIYTRVLAPADYGAIDLLAIVAGFVASIVTLEIVQALARLFPDEPDERQKRSYASTALWFVVASYALFLVVAWLFADQIGTLLLRTQGQGALVRVATIAMVGNGLFYVVQSQLRWTLRAREYAISGVAYALVTIIASAIFVVGLRTGVIGVFWGQLVGAVAGILVAGRFTAASFGVSPDVAKLREMLAFSVPLVPSVLALLVSLYVDRLAINALMTLSAVGLFGIGYRVASLSQLVLAGFQSSITPLIYATHREATTPMELARIFRLYAAIAMALWLSLGLYAREIVAVATTPTYEEASVVVPVLVPAVLLAGAYVFLPGLSIAKRTGRIAAISIAGAVLNAALNIALIPPYGIFGAASATLLSAMIAFVANVVASQRTYRVPHDWVALGAAFVVVGAVISIGWLLVPLGVAGLVAKLGLLSVGGVSLVALRLVHLDELKRLALAIRSRP